MPLVPRRSLGSSSTVNVIVTGLVLVLGIRAAVLLAQFLFRSAAVQRFHVETAFVWFVLGIILVVALRTSPAGPDEPAPVRSLDARYIAVIALFAIALYWPALSAGFFSDDFSLLPRARALELGAVHGGLFRPLPMGLWAVLERVGAPERVYHLVNVVLHAVNAWLGGAIVGGWVRERAAPYIAALLMLAAPLAVEPVVWVSGLFDVLMTTFALTTVLIFRLRETNPTPAFLWATVCGAVASMLSKETGVMVPALLVCDAVARNSRAYRRDAALYIVAAISIVYAAARLAVASDGNTPPTAVTKYVVQRGIFQTFGALAEPWHGDVIATRPGVVLFYVLLIVALLVWFVLAARSRRQLRVPMAAVAWIVIAIAPVGTIIWIPEDLQGSRYLYLAWCGWAGLLCALAFEPEPGGVAPPGAESDPRSRRIGYVVMAALIMLAGYSTRRNIGPWVAAGQLRDAILESARSDRRIAACGSIALSDLPDTERGVYVFRNGVPEAFRRQAKLAVDASAPPDCAFKWDGSRRRFVPRADP